MGHGSKNKLAKGDGLRALLGLAAACPAACLGAGGDDVASTAEILSLVVSLVMILGAAGAAAWFLRRWQGSLGRREGPLRLEHIIAVGPRERLAMVRAGTRYLVVGITPTAITRIAELQEGEQEVPKAETNVIDPPPPNPPGSIGPTGPSSS